MLKLIFYIALFYIAYRLIRLVYNIFLISKGYSGTGKSGEYSSHQKREGETNIDHIPEDEQKHSASDKNNGDYIDYKEVKE